MDLPAGRGGPVESELRAAEADPCASQPHAVLSGEFNNGAWVTFPISVAAGGAVTITVDKLAGPNAVLSGIFLE